MSPPFVKKTTYVRLPKENLFCSNNASENYNFISWRHQKLLLAANQLQDSTFLFEIDSEDIGISKIKITVKVITMSIVWIGVSTTHTSKTHNPNFLPSLPPPLNLTTVQAPFLGNYSYILVFCDPPPYKSDFLWTRIILKTFILNPIPSLKSN